MPSASVSIELSETRNVFVSLTPASGTLTVAAALVTLRDVTGTVAGGVNGAGATGFTSGASASPEVWYTLSPGGIGLTVGAYTLAFLVTDTNGITYEPVVAVAVLADGSLAGSVYPNGSDLKNFLKSTEILPATLTPAQDRMDFDGAMAAASAEWERRSGYTPFLAAVQTRTHDPPGPEQGPTGIYIGVGNVGGGRKLSLHAGLLSLTQLRVGVTLTNPGAVLTEHRDFWLRQQNAPFYLRPYTSIEFVVPQWGPLQSITIAGTFGFCHTVPADVSFALLNYGACLLAPQMALQISGGLYSQRRLNTEVRYSGAKQSPLSLETDAWMDVFRTCLKRYHRPYVI